MLIGTALWLAVVTAPTSDFESLAQIIARVAEYNEKSRPAKARRWSNVNWFAMGAVLVLLLDAGTWFQGFRVGILLPGWGYDFSTYHDAAWSWISGHGFYLPYQLAGPYMPGLTDPQPVMYPPTTAPLFLLLTPIPAVWWVAPFAIVGWRLRHAGWSRWALGLALLLWPGSITAIITGNPGMWIMAALSLGLGSVVLLKPTLAPFLLTGIRTRRWWAFAVGIALASLALLPMWFDYLTVLENVRGPDLLYSVWQYPLIAVGLLARRS